MGGTECSSERVRLLRETTPSGREGTRDEVVQGVLLLVGRGKGWRRWRVLIASDLGRLDNGAMKRHADSYVTTTKPWESSSSKAAVAEGACWQDWGTGRALRSFSARGAKGELGRR